MHRISCTLLATLAITIPTFAADPTEGLGFIPQVGQLSNSTAGVKTANTLIAGYAKAPTAVDLSTKKFFPNIGDQGASGSCVAWATEYYAMTYEWAKALNLDGNNAEVKMSPKFVFNLLNNADWMEGVDTVEKHARVLKDNGCATAQKVPFSKSTDWPTSPDTWKSALYNRISSYSFVKTPKMPWIKQQINANKLAIVVLAAPIEAWEDEYGYDRGWYLATTKGAVPNQVVMREPHRISAYIYDHAMTVVGYNDNVSVDIDLDGKIEANEIGCVKLANSWGSNYGTKGFYWMPYYWIEQGALIEGMTLSVPSKKTTPTNTVSLNVSTGLRSDINVTISGTSTINPMRNWIPGAKAFNGWLSFDTTAIGTNLTTTIADKGSSFETTFKDMELRVKGAGYFWDKATFDNFKTNDHNYVTITRNDNDANAKFNQSNMTVKIDAK